MTNFYFNLKSRLVFRLNIQFNFMFIIKSFLLAQLFKDIIFIKKMLKQSILLNVIFQEALVIYSFDYENFIYKLKIKKLFL